MDTPTILKLMQDDTANALGDFIHVCDAGRIALADIVGREVKEFVFKDQEKPVRRVLLALKGRPEAVLVPMKVWGDLKNLLEKKPNLIAFEVMKSGSGQNTQYQVVPELRGV